MAVVETLSIPTSAYPKNTLSVTLDDGSGTLASSTIKFTDHTGTVVSVPLTLANARKLFLSCQADGTPATKAKHT